MDAAPLQIHTDEQWHLHFSISSPISCTFRFSPWSAGLHYERLEDGSWEAETLDCGFPLLGLAQSHADNPDVLAFIEQIPLPVRERTAPFHFAQTTLLRWLATNPYAAELFETAPLLLWLLIGRQQTVDWPDSHVEQLLRGSRIHILSAVAGTGQKSALKWLARLEIGKGEGSDLAIIINALRGELYRCRWAREPHVPLHWIAGATRHMEIADTPAYHRYCTDNPTEGPRFIRDLSSHARFFDDALNVARVVGIVDAEIALNRCTDFSAVRRLHDRWTDRLNQCQALVVEGKQHFPPPPFEGTEAIHPITTREDLQAEGKLMHHCVSIYDMRIEKGECYIYRILEPERATIELRFRGQQVRLGQVCLAYNARPAQETTASCRASDSVRLTRYPTRGSY